MISFCSIRITALLRREIVIIATQSCYYKADEVPGGRLCRAPNLTVLVSLRYFMSVISANGGACDEDNLSRAALINR